MSRCSCSLGKLSRLVEPIIPYLLDGGQPRYGYELPARRVRRTVNRGSSTELFGALRVPAWAL